VGTEQVGRLVVRIQWGCKKMKDAMDMWRKQEKERASWTDKHGVMSKQNILISEEIARMGGDHMQERNIREMCVWGIIEG